MKNGFNSLDEFVVPGIDIATHAIAHGMGEFFGKRAAKKVTGEGKRKRGKRKLPYKPTRYWKPVSKHASGVASSRHSKPGINEEPVLATLGIVAGGTALNDVANHYTRKYGPKVKKWLKKKWSKARAWANRTNKKTGGKHIPTHPNTNHKDIQAHKNKFVPPARRQRNTHHGRPITNAYYTGSPVKTLKIHKDQHIKEEIARIQVQTAGRWIDQLTVLNNSYDILQGMKNVRNTYGHNTRVRAVDEEGHLIDMLSNESINERLKWLLSR